ncbi:MAG: sugar transferase [Vicingus serpentipes]|nr:sugar transferase [Vicingus serpentipes]
MNKALQIFKYIFLDALSAAIAWTFFFVFRKTYLESIKYGYDIPIDFDANFYKALIFIPLYWIVLHFLIGTYNNIYRKSRLKEFGQTLLISLIGTLVLFFVLLLDDEVDSYNQYYKSYLVLFGLQFFITEFFRFLLTTYTGIRIKNRKIGFNTLIIGSNENAVELYKELEGQKYSAGNKLIGFSPIVKKEKYLLEGYLPHIGDCASLKEIIQNHNVEEVIIAIESSEHDSLGTIINELEGLPVIIKIIPDMYDILSGSVKMTSIFGTPLIVINKEIMPLWQQSIKRMIDVVTSAVVLILFLPVYIITALVVKMTSKGPAFFVQERIGIHGKPFMIYKFRSMCTDAEKDGPALSSQKDMRITNFGRFMRKVRLDEFPQFFNVLIGDMSLVGPRPERQFFIDQITQKAPHYNHLLKVRPGITSWGQVKYGYAENVDQMVERLKFDIIYIENMSLLVDFKILIYTVLIVVRGAGQ